MMEQVQRFDFTPAPREKARAIQARRAGRRLILEGGAEGLVGRAPLMQCVQTQRQAVAHLLGALGEIPRFNAGQPQQPVGKTLSWMQPVKNKPAALRNRRGT